MSIADSFRNAVACGDIKRVRIMMKDRLLVDPTFTEFDEMFNFVQNVDGLFDTHDGRDFESNQSAWDDNYMNKLMVQVVGNFSYERIHHLKDVVRYLRPLNKRLEKPPKNVNEEDLHTELSQKELLRKQYREQKRQDELDNCIIRKKVVTGGIAGGVVTGSVVAFVGGEYVSIVVGVVTGALVVGLVIAAEETL